MSDCLICGKPAATHPACVRRVVSQRDLAEETLVRIETERIVALKERDEAQDLATSAALQIRFTRPDDPWLQEMRGEYPWLDDLIRAWDEATP